MANIQSTDLGLPPAWQMLAPPTCIQGAAEKAVISECHQGCALAPAGREAAMTAAQQTGCPLPGTCSTCSR